MRSLKRPGGGGGGYETTARTAAYRPLIQIIVFRPKEEEDTRDWRKVRGGELHDCTVRKFCLDYHIKEKWFDKSCTLCTCTILYDIVKGGRELGSRTPLQ